MDDDWDSLIGANGDQLLSFSSMPDFGQFGTANLDSYLFDNSTLNDDGFSSSPLSGTSSTDTNGPPLFEEEDQLKSEAANGNSLAISSMTSVSTTVSTNINPVYSGASCVKKEEYGLTSDRTQLSRICTDSHHQNPIPNSSEDKKSILHNGTMPSGVCGAPIRPKSLHVNDGLRSAPSSPITYHSLRAANAASTQYRITGSPSIASTGKKPRLILTTALPSVSYFGAKPFGSGIGDDADLSMCGMTDVRPNITPSPPGSDRSSSPGGFDCLGGFPGGSIMFNHRGRSKMHELALRHRLITEQTVTREPGCLSLSAEEKRTLIQEGYAVPQRTPLTSTEEQALKIVRRKIKNKLSAQESRRKRKEYMETLEQRVQGYHGENSQLRHRLRQLERSNRGLLGQLKKLQQTTAAAPSGHSTDALPTPPYECNDSSPASGASAYLQTSVGGGRRTGVMLTAFMLLFMIWLPTIPIVTPLTGDESISYFVPALFFTEFASDTMMPPPIDSSLSQSRVMAPDDADDITTLYQRTACSLSHESSTKRPSECDRTMENNTHEDEPSTTISVNAVVA